MAVTSVVGLQWGDEAKGKIVDLLTGEHEIVVRYQGGNNAGHTVQFAGQTYKLSLLPSGILHDDVTAVIGNGVVVNPKALLEEIAGIESTRRSVAESLWISDRAHVVLPYHMAEEAALEKARRDQAIGTTMRGIGTCYRDKAGRVHAVRVGDLYRQESFRDRLEEIVSAKNKVLVALDPAQEPLDAAAIYDEYMGYADRLRPYVTDTTSRLHKALESGRSILFEGAQGSLLDVDHGTFPFVTSSNSSSAGIHSGCGVPERAVERMIGVVKAYTTRVGGGPFPTELEDETGDHIRRVGREFGTVTGRPRRCGWFDAVATAYSARVCGVDSIAIMLLDVLSELEELHVCEAYDIRGERVTDFPSHVEDLAVARPILRRIPGWQSDISKARTWDALPAAAQRYVEEVAKLLGRPAEIVSVGPDREQTIFR